MDAGGYFRLDNILRKDYDGTEREGLAAMSKKKMTSAVSSDIGMKIEIATQALERNMNLISGCDNKASIVLGVLGAFLGFLITNDDGLKTIAKIMEQIWIPDSVTDVFYLICFAVSIIIVITGLGFLVAVLVARKGKGENSDLSLLYYGGIIRKEKNTFSKEFFSMTEDGILEALLNDLYANASIAKKKYDYYNKGYMLSITGFSAFAVVLMLGWYYYVR